MEIKTKYSVNQKVWFIEDNKVKNEEILELTFSKDSSCESIFYYFKEKENIMHNWKRMIEEKDVFSTKEELIKNI